MDGCCCFMQLLKCTILFGMQRTNAGGSVLVVYEIPPAFLTRIGGQVFAGVGVVSEQSSHTGLFWNLNVDKVLH